MDRQAKRKKNFLNTAKGYLPGIVVRQIQAIPQTLYLVDYGPIANQKPSQRVAHCEFSVIHCFSAGSSRGLTRFHRFVTEGVTLPASARSDELMKLQAHVIPNNQVLVHTSHNS